MAKHPTHSPSVGMRSADNTAAGDASAQSSNAEKATQPPANARKRVEGLNPLIADTIFPDAAAVFNSPTTTLDSVKDTACIVLDTNALLLPYVFNKAGLTELEHTYSRLSKDGRLYVPAQVAREFARNRAIKIAELYQSLTSRRDSFQPRQVKPDGKRHSLLDSFGEYKRITDIEKRLGEIDTEVQTLAKEYRDKIGEVLARIRKWEWNDPISQLYSRIFKPDLIFSLTKPEKDIREAHLHRFNHEIPPGYADRHEKADGGVGDLLIWYAILEIGKHAKRSVILVTGEKKEDWWHRAGGEPLYPRYELMDEFRRYTGHSFHMMHLSDLLETFGATTDIVQDVRNKETERSVSFVEMLRAEMEAREAVKNWFVQIAAIIHETHWGPFDFVIQYGKLGIGVSVKMLDNPDFLHKEVVHARKRFADFPLRPFTRLEQTWLILVFETQKQAQEIAFKVEQDGFGHRNSMTIIPGHVTAQGIFAPAFEALVRSSDEGT